MTPKQLWDEFSQAKKIEDVKYDVWAFGCVPDKLAELTMRGTKTATASLHVLYEIENEQLPEVGLYNVILNSKGEAVCIIQTIKIDVVPFDEVSAEHAYKEGEGDRSLAYWREVHRECFTEELKETNITFDETMLVVCEEFQLVWLAK